jgi:hypothetical protein
MNCSLLSSHHERPTFNDRLRRAKQLWLSGLIVVSLVGCATESTIAPKHALGNARLLPPTQTVGLIPAQLRRVTIDGEAYFSTRQKATFEYTIASDGVGVTWKFVDNATREGINASAATTAAATLASPDCTENGSLHNDRAAYFPYGAVLTRGATLSSVRAPGINAPLVQLALSADDDSALGSYKGPGKHDREFSFANCVGAQRADGYGHRLLSYVPNDAVIALDRGAGSLPLEIALDALFQPYVLYRYADDAVSTVPSRIVLVMIDSQLRRVVIHYQSIASASEDIERIEFRAVAPAYMRDLRSMAETNEAFRARAEQSIAALAKCELPTKYAEPCADRSRASAVRGF